MVAEPVSIASDPALMSTAPLLLPTEPAVFNLILPDCPALDFASPLCNATEPIIPDDAIILPRVPGPASTVMPAEDD